MIILYRLHQEPITHVSPPKKKRDRFNGTSEEEVMKMRLPDRIKHGLDILIVSVNNVDKSFALIDIDIRGEYLLT